MFSERVWKDGEKLVQDYMKNNGYKIACTNFSAVGVELDIVAILPAKVQKKKLKAELTQKLKLEKNFYQKKLLKNTYKGLIKNLKDILVVTEVKARSSNKFGEGMEAVGYYKQKNLLKGTEVLMKKKEFSGLQVRFDVASVDSGKVTYIENAFEV